MIHTHELGLEVVLGVGGKSIELVYLFIPGRI